MFHLSPSLLPELVMVSKTMDHLAKDTSRTITSTITIQSISNGQPLSRLLAAVEAIQEEFTMVPMMVAQIRKIFMTTIIIMADQVASQTIQITEALGIR
jgi:hypothetical protein